MIISRHILFKKIYEITLVFSQKLVNLFVAFGCQAIELTMIEKSPPKMYWLTNL